MSQLARLTDEELLRHAQVDFDPITGTALEAELLRRFEERLDEFERSATLVKLCDNQGIDDRDALQVLVDKVAALDERVDGLALLDVLLDFDIDDPEVLRKALQRDRSLTSALDDLRQPLDALLSLTTSA